MTDRAVKSEPLDRTLLATRLTLTRKEAAAALGVSVDFFEAHVQSDLRLIRKGALRLVPVAELQRWVERNAARTLVEQESA